MARIYRPSTSETSSSPFESSLVTNFIQFELIGGAFTLVAGGFVLRVRDSYALIVVGLTLVALGCFRLWQRGRDKRGAASGALGDDRVLRALRHKLDANYSIAVDYPLGDDESIDYLVLGPPGVIVLTAWEKNGDIEESESGRKWVLTRTESGEGSPDSESVLNPIIENEKRIQRLRDTVEKPGWLKPLHHYVVLLGRRADCPPLEDDHVVEMNELLGEILSKDAEAVLDWEDVDELEQMLELKK